MTIQFSRMPTALAALVLAALAGCTPVSLTPPVQPAPQSQSVADADRKLVQVASERTQAEAAFVASEQLCYKKFLVNRCLDSAREKRRATLAALRAVEIEAEHFKRKAAVEERDREVAEAERKFQAEDARMTAEEHAQPAEPAPKTGTPVAGKVAEHAAKEKQRAAEEKAGAAQRAANVQAYEKRKRESEERQREIEEKKKAKAKEAEGK